MSTPSQPIDALPGYRRSIMVESGPGWSRSRLEDDFHHMAVTVRHENGVATAVEGEMIRAPWSTCPGAQAKIAETFTGVPLDAFPARGAKAANCTHLHDLAILAAARADAAEPVLYDVLVTDAVDGVRRCELRRDGEPILSWSVKGVAFAEPGPLAGRPLGRPRDWLELIDPALREEARLLGWASMVAGGRDFFRQANPDPGDMPPSCYTFQPERKPLVRRAGAMRDFSAEGAAPLEQEAAPLRAVIARR